MKSKRWLGLAGVTVLGATAAVLGGCGSKNTTTSTGMGGSGTAATGSTTTKSSAAVTTSKAATSTGTGTSGNHSFATAADITPNDTMAPATMTLVDAMTADYFKFMGKKGERVVSYTAAQSLLKKTDDNTIVDTVITLYDANKNQIAQDDDAWPRNGRDSQLFTTLPADGVYYIKVDDCNDALGPMNCAPASGLMTFDYQIAINDTDKVTSPEANATAASTMAAPALVTYKLATGGMPGQYSVDILDGAFSAAGDQYFTFTPPADTMVGTTQRARAEFWLQPVGTKNGDGSTSNVTVSVLDGTGATVIGQINQTNYSDGDNATNGPADLSVPVTPGTKYLLKVSPSATPAAPATDFYYLEHFAGSYFYGDKEQTTPHTAANPQPLMTPAMVMGTVFAVDADINTAGVEQDWYSMTIPATSKTVSLFCDAQRAGSGLRGAKFGIYTSASPTATAAGEYTEAANKESGLSGTAPNCLSAGCDIALPANTTTIYLKAEAASQDATVKGTYYHCFVSVQ